MRVGPVVDGERLWELGELNLLPAGLCCLCCLLGFAVVLWVTLLDVLEQVGLLHVEEWTLGAGKHLGGHLHSGTWETQRIHHADCYTVCGNAVISSLRLLL